MWVIGGVGVDKDDIQEANVLFNDLWASPDGYVVFDSVHASTTLLDL